MPLFYIFGTYSTQLFVGANDIKTEFLCSDCDVLVSFELVRSLAKPYDRLLNKNKHKFSHRNLSRLSY